MIAKKTCSMGVFLYADMFEDYESSGKLEEKRTDLFAIGDPAFFRGEFGL
jgi:hypothetical protein